jgi:NitT/TauT family transport system permease protein
MGHPVSESATTPRILDGTKQPPGNAAPVLSKNLLTWFGRVMVLVLPLAAWEIASGAGRLPLFIYSKPSLIWEQLVEWLVDGTIVHNTQYTLANAAFGYVLGVGAGALLAVVFFRFRQLGEIYLPFVTAMNAMPREALAPLTIALFGFGVAANVSLIVIIILFVNFFSVYGGLSSMEGDHLLWARSQGASEMQLWTTVRSRAIVRWVLGSMRLSIGLALSGAIVAEFLGGARGIGYLVSSSTNFFQSAGVFAGIIIVIAIVIVVDSMLRLCERRWAHWVGQS